MAQKINDIFPQLRTWKMKELKKRGTFTYRGSTLTRSLTWTMSSWCSCLSAGSGEVLQGAQEEAHGPDQKLWKKKKRAPTNETRCGRDPPQENGHRPRDDWHHCWCSQRQGLHTGWGQAWNDRTLLKRVLHLLQTTKKDKPHVTIKAPCLFKPEYPLDSNSSSLSYDNSPQTLHLLFKFQFLFKSVEIILAAQCWKRGETNDNVICLMKCANFVETMNFKNVILCLM